MGIKSSVWWKICDGEVYVWMLLLFWWYLKLWELRRLVRKRGFGLEDGCWIYLGCLRCLEVLGGVGVVWRGKGGDCRRGV